MSFLEPLLEYIAEITRLLQPGKIITVVVPEFVSNSRVTSALHTNTAELLHSQLKRQEDFVIINVPYQVHKVTIIIRAEKKRKFKPHPLHRLAGDIPLPAR